MNRKKPWGQNLFCVLWPNFMALFLALSVWGAEQPPFKFLDHTAEAGLSAFRHELGTEAKDYIIDTMGSGVCVADVDNDGWDDVYFVNAHRFDAVKAATKPVNRLYRNRGDGTFEDITLHSGTGDEGMGMSCSFGDMDNDGDEDLYVGNYGENVLYLNNGQGVFAAITHSAGVATGGFTTSTVMGDVNGDGWLDLYVGNYVEAAPQLIQGMGLHGDYRGLKVMLGPLAFKPQPDFLYINNQDRTFTNTAQSAGLDNSRGRAMGSVLSDFDGDNDLDLYVANDRSYNFLYKNRGDVTFEEMGILSGSAVDYDGKEQGSMGVVAGDVNRDSRLDLLVTSYHNEPISLYLNLGEMLFQDATRRYQLVENTWSRVTWGNAIADFDNDGLEDIVIANGHIYPKVHSVNPETHYRQTNTLFWNRGESHMLDVTLQSGPGFQGKKVSRGLAISDYDQDGDLDIFINNLDDHPTLLNNQSITQNWVQVRVYNGDRSPIGSLITVTAGDLTMNQEIYGGSGYQSQSSRVAHFGVGHAAFVDVKVRFPDGHTAKQTRVKTNRRIFIKRR